MSNLFATMRASLTALETVQKSLAVTQNNVTNASTPGYVRQSLGVVALEFDPSTGMAGGVRDTGLVSSRSEYLEAAVRSEISVLSKSETTANMLTSVQSALDINDMNGVATTLSALFAAFSEWSVSPNNAGAKESVYAAAQDVASSFNRAASGLNDTATRTEREIRGALNEINDLTLKIRDFNVSRRNGAQQDAGTDAQLHETVERLATLVDVRALWQEDGTVTVLAGGQGALVVGDHQYQLHAEYNNTDALPLNPDALTQVHIRDDAGTEITNQIHGGKLSALVETRNKTLPKLIGDAQHPGELNELAQKVADRVNEILRAGYPQLDPPFSLFVYGNSTVSIAQTIQANPTLAPALLNATDITAVPTVANGVALRAAKLAHASDAEDMLGGLSMVEYFGKLAADAGRALAGTKEDINSRIQLLDQAKNLRAETSGISLNEEAVQIVQLQHAYQATARMITTVDEMLQTIINLGRA